jgi:hypothetical protein
VWCDKNENNKKLGYHEEGINPNHEIKSISLVMISLKKKTNMAKIRMNSH